MQLSPDQKKRLAEIDALTVKAYDEVKELKEQKNAIKDKISHTHEFISRLTKEMQQINANPEDEDDVKIE